MKHIFSLLLFFIVSQTIKSQNDGLLLYYLPDLNYNLDIQSPGEYFGFSPGEWHLSHDQVLNYMYYLALSSERVFIKEYGKTHEQRRLIHLFVSHPDNINNINVIKKSHIDLSFPDRANNVGISNLPTVINLGYTVHGNEPSGMNAAVYIAYYLAAAPEESIERILRSCVVIIDPCLNPDGAQRFSSWVNMHRGKNLNSNSAAREFNEVWPGGRGNHYWFDLNRDWLPLVHPESRGRVQVFHEWLPNIVCDYHEMGTDATYFFQPGIKGRTNPLTPDKNIELTARIGQFHARYLDEIGSLYYSREDFDDFFYGKGSTYPDAHGSIGILFEQASSRGHLKDSRHGPVSFPFTIRNQVRASLSSIQAAQDMRIELLEYKRSFFKNAIEEAGTHPVKAYVFDAGTDFTRMVRFMDILNIHQIEAYQFNGEITISGRKYGNSSVIVPLQQRQYKLIRAIFDTNTDFKDSLFYDISSWTFPLAFDLNYAKLSADQFNSSQIGSKINLQDWIIKPQKVPGASFAYLIEWDDASVAPAVYELLSNDILIKSSRTNFEIETHAGLVEFKRGSLLIPLGLQKLAVSEIQNVLQAVVNKYGIRVYVADTGASKSGVDLGSPQFDILRRPEIIVMAGSGVSSLDCGEVWYFLDQQLGIAPAVVDLSQLARVDWKSFNTLIMPGGNYSINQTIAKKIKDWVSDGGLIIGMGQSNKWLTENNLAFLSDTTLVKSDSKGQMPYNSQRDSRGAGLISGSIFSVDIDLTHPLFYGYEKKTIPVFRRGTDFYKPSKNPYATPAVYSDQFLLSGYLPKDLAGKVGGLSSVQLSGTGNGVVISFLDNPVFRGFWSGTGRMFSNAIFLGHTISSATVQRSEE